jgi:BirA family biotin operon repressor/biotin-[acetyl-CoA-carboxylase] ligase
MTVLQVNDMKGRILQALRSGSGYVSGQALASELGVSRVSIWKHIRSLIKDGYVIEAGVRGYKVVCSPDLLFPYEFPLVGQRIHYFSEVGSTMDEARELARKGAPEGTIVLAEAQGHGRGRLSREWLSPRGGIYFTLTLRPRMNPGYAPRINLMAAIAVGATIRRLYGLEAELKWPNDVLIAGKKVCGILSDMDAELDAVDFVNVGIGINANSPVDQFRETATSLKHELGREISRREFFSALLAEIERIRPLLMEADLLDEWRRMSGTLNNEVRISSFGEVIMGRALDIDPTGALIVKEPSGALIRIIAGDCTHLRVNTGDGGKGAVGSE